MSYEVWLRPNRRPALAVMVASALVFVIAFAAIVFTRPWATTGGSLLAIAAVVFAAGSAFVFALAWRRAARPRVVRRQSGIVFNLGSAEPIDVPLDVVEAFFLGQGPAELPAGWGNGWETVNLVARLSQRATDWHRREVDPRVAAWCDGYITIRGTHCEPLDVEAVHRLNRRLARAKREEPGT